MDPFSAPDTLIMTVPVITDYFGSQAEVLTDITDITATIDASNPVLVIPFNGLASVGLNNVANAVHPDVWLSALIKRAYTFTKSDVDEDSMVEIADPTLTLNTRKGNTVVSSDYRLTVNQIFKLAGQTLEFDPDNIRPDYTP
jgi:hypothetical protein